VVDPEIRHGHKTQARGFDGHKGHVAIESRCKTQGPNATNGLFSKDRFVVDLEDDLVTCPAAVTVSIRRGKDGSGLARFSDACTSCALRAECTNAKEGRSIAVGPNEDALTRPRSRQRDPGWVADYRATRPKVARKIAHLMRRKHGGRRARVRGRVRVAAVSGVRPLRHSAWAGAIRADLGRLTLSPIGARLPVHR
jgi:hypothetical protein